MSYASRVYRHRNAHTQEQAKKETGFFNAFDRPGKSKSKGAFFQAKLSVGQPGDPYEKEADAVAETVVNNHNSPASGLQKKPISSIQRLSAPMDEEELSTNDARMRRDRDIQEKPAIQMMCPECEKEKKEKLQKMDDPEKKKKEKGNIQKMDDPEKKKKKEPAALQTKAGGETQASTQLSSHIESEAGSGRQMPRNTLEEMNQAFGADFTDVNLHTDADAVQMNKELGAQAFTHGRDIFFNSGKFNTETADGKRLLAHELTHVVQQGGADKKKIQTDLAIEPTHPEAQEPGLTNKQVQDAITYNRERYNEDNTRLIQDIVGGPVNGRFGEETIRMIALYQAQNGLTADGMVGPDTFHQLTDELRAGLGDPDTCLTMFRVGLVTPMEIHAGAAPNTANIFGHFDVDIEFTPHCDCSRFEYRQFISGRVTRNGVDLANQFTIPPANQLPPIGNFVEDGNTTLPSNGRYGHRNLPANNGVPNRYTDASGTIDMHDGCRFHSFDEPGVTGAPANPGDVYVFDFRFFGDIRKDGLMIERKFWSVRETITIP